MRKNILLLFFTVLSFSLRGQESKWFFSLNMGETLPLGAFAEDQSAELNEGFAGNGFSLSLESNYAINYSFGLKGITLLNTNSVNRLPLWTKLVDRMNQHFPIETEDQEFLSMTINPWLNNSIMAGPEYTFTFKNIKLDFYALGGFNVVHLPRATFTYQNPGNNWIYVHHGLNSTDFSYGLMAGTALRIPMSERFDFSISVNYFQSHASGRYEELRITDNGSSFVTEQLLTGSTSVPIKLVSASLGFVYNLR